MKVIIAGAGEIGIALARYLRSEQDDIVLIDKDVERLGTLSEQLDIQTVVGSASYPSVLERAGAEHADVFLAVTGDDETNLVSCGVANSVFHIPKRIARISSSEYLSSRYKSFLQAWEIEAILSPEKEMSDRITENLEITGSMDMREMGAGLVRFVGLKCRKTSPLAGKTIAEVRQMTSDFPVNIVAVRRRFQLMPLSDVTIKAGDDVYFIVDTAHLTQALDVFGYEKESPRYIMIYGGGKVGFQLAKRLEEDKVSHNITIVENDEERAQFLAEKLESSLVINGDALDDNLIEELNLKNYDMAIATTNSDESNILLSLVSKRNGIGRTCALIHNPLYNTVLSGLGIDSMINPNAVMVSAILQHLRKGRVRDDYFIQSGVGEVLEVEALATSKITKNCLGKVKIPEGVVIGGILRGDLFMLPSKDLIVQEKDIVFVFVTQGHVQEAESLFSVGINFF